MRPTDYNMCEYWMPKHKKHVSEEYSFLALKIRSFNVSINASINCDARVPRYYHDDTKVYDFKTCLDIEGISTYPEEREGEAYSITVYGAEPSSDNFNMTLVDCHVRDEDGLPRYRKVSGKQVPVYDVPKGIGLLERHRGAKCWGGWVWVSQPTVSDMLALLPHVQPLYIHIHELRIGRKRWIAGLTLQTTDPAEE